MLACHNPEWVFVAIPKTATRSIALYLKTHFNTTGEAGHQTVIPDKWKSHYSFCVVRNPYDRMCSYWWSTCMRPNSKMRWSFEKFLNGYYRPQLRWVLGNRINKILRYETLEQDFRSLPFIPDDAQLPWANATVFDRPNKKLVARPSTEELVTPQIRSLIKRIYHDDFEQLGYEQ